MCVFVNPASLHHLHPHFRQALLLTFTGVPRLFAVIGRESPDGGPLADGLVCEALFKCRFLMGVVPGLETPCTSRMKKRDRPIL